jgi:hypothetical protein
MKLLNRLTSATALAAIMGVSMIAAPAVAQENFFEGKTISVVIRSTAGGG